MIKVQQHGALHGMKAICAYLDKSPNTVLRLIRECGLPVTKVGGEWMSDVEAVTSWRRLGLEKILQKKRLSSF